MFTRLNCYTFVLTPENQISICAQNCRFWLPTVTQELKPLDVLYDHNFCKDLHETFEIRRQVPTVKKKLTKLKKNTHISLSTCRSANALFTLIFPIEDLSVKTVELIL